MHEIAPKFRKRQPPHLGSAGKAKDAHVHFTFGGHVDTLRIPFADGRRRRRHSAEFKADVVAACCQLGVSTASVALAYSVNPNLVRRWAIDAEATVDRGAPKLPNATMKAPVARPSFVSRPASAREGGHSERGQLGSE
jgi:transposase-like protein